MNVEEAYSDALGADREVMSEDLFWTQLTELAASANHPNATDLMKSVSFLLARADYKFNGEPLTTEDSN